MREEPVFLRDICEPPGLRRQMNAARGIEPRLLVVADEALLRAIESGKTTILRCLAGQTVRTGP